MNLIGGHFCDKAVNAVKENKSLRGTGDNWDLRVLKGHMTKELQNEDIHLFASNLYINRVDFNHLSNDAPIRNLNDCNRCVFLLNRNDLTRLRNNFMVLVGRICFEYLPKFKFLKKVIPKHIQHEFSYEMAKSSVIISLPIIDANEVKYDDCVKILRTYENWIFEIYKKSGRINEREVENPIFPKDDASRPDQPGAHFQSSEDDPMREMKIPFAGDQLTRVRFAGAKDLLADAHTPTDRFEHCSPFKPVMWHCKASFLQGCYGMLYDSTSFNQQGTLKFFREKYNRRNVTPTKVLDSYDGCEELLISVGKAYIVVGLMKHFGMASLDSYPTLNKFNSNMCHKETTEIQSYYNESIGSFVDNYIFQKGQSPEPGEDEDYIKNYALLVSYLTMILLQLKDTAAEGDGERNLTNQKLLMPIFKSFNTHSKYALEMFVSIAQIECLSTPRLSAQLKWGFFCNWTGGMGRNIEDDLAQEISNNISKNVVKRLGANKSLTSISTICKATTGIKALLENLDKVLNVPKNSSRHTTASPYEDELQMINDLLQLDPFEYTPGRFHPSFRNIKRSPQLYLDTNHFHQWLTKHKKQVSGM